MRQLNFNTMVSHSLSSTNDPPIVHRNCLLCSFVTQEKKRKEEAARAIAKGKESKKLYRVQEQQDDRWLRCKHCCGCVCLRCATNFPIRLRARGVTEANLPWLTAADELVQSTVPVLPIEKERCHACMYRDRIRGMTNKHGIDGEPVEGPEPVLAPLPQNPTTSPSAKVFSVDGVLYFPEYGIGIAPSTRRIDSHVLAHQEKTSGVLHGALQNLKAADWSARGIFPKTDERGDILADGRCSVTIKNGVSHQPETYKVRVTMVKYKDEYKDGTRPLPETGGTLTEDAELQAMRIWLRDKSCDRERKQHGTDYWLLLGGTCCSCFVVPRLL